MDDLFKKYDFVGEFHQGVAIIVKDSRYGIILEGGIEIISPSYDYISTFKDGFAKAIQNGECITINLSGRECINTGYGIIEIPKVYDEVRSFYNGVACVRKQDKWGVIDKDGNELVTPQFSYISDFCYSIASYKSQSNKWGYITPEGYISRDIYDDLEIDVDGNLITTRSVRFFIDAFRTIDIDYKKIKLNQDGFILIKLDKVFVVLPSYIYFAQNISEGIICGQNSDGLWGAITVSGQQVIPFEYTTLQDFKEGRSFSTDRDRKLYLLSSEGKKIKVFDSYTHAASFVQGCANIYKNKLCGLVNKSGEVLLQPNYTDIKYSGIPNYYILIKDGREGVFHVTTQTEIKPIYKRIVSIEKDYIIVEIPILGKCKIDFNGKCFVYYNNLKTYLPDWCLGGLDYENGICYAVSKEGKWGIVNLDGKTICKPIYDKIVKREENLIYVETNADKDSWKHEIYGLFDIETQLAIPAEYAEYPQKFHCYYLICKGNQKYGAIDIQGNVVVKPEYSNIKWLNGYYQTFKDDKCGLVKSDGTIILQSRYYSIEVVIKGLFKVFSYKDSKVFELCNDDGIIHRWLLEIGNMNEDGNFPVVYNRRNGWVNSLGQFVVRDENNKYIPLPDKFEWAEDFEKGVAKVWKGTYYYIDKDFNQVLFVDNKAVSIKTKIDRIIYENSERCRSFIFKLEDKYGLLSKDGKLLIEPKYFHLDYYSENLYIVDAKEEYYDFGKYGIVDEHENIILPLEYTELKNEGKFLISKKTSVYQLKDEYGFLTDRYERVDKYGLINSKRKIVFEPVFQSIIGFKKGFFVLEDNKWYIVDNKHFTKKETNYGSIERLTNNFFRFSILGYGYYYGVLDSSGKECLAPRYKSIGEVNYYKVAVIDLDGKKGLTDEKYRILVEPQYDYVSEFKKGRATVEKRNLQGMCGIIRGEIDTKGNFFEISELTEYDISNGKAKQLMVLSNGNIVFMKDDSNPSFKYCAVVDNANNIVLPYKYYGIEELEDGSYRGLVKPEGSFCNEYRFLNKNFKDVIQDSNESGILTGDISKTVIPLDTIKIKSDERIYPCEPASEGIVWIYENNREKIGLATIDGEMLIEPCYGKIEPFVNGYAKVNNGYWREYKSNEDYSYRTKRSFIEGKWGCIDSFGKLVIPMEYDSIQIEEDSSFIVKKSILDYSSEWCDSYIQVAGRLNKEGDLIIKNERGEYLLADKRFDWQEDFNDEGRSKVYYKEGTGFVNNKYQLIVSSWNEGTEIIDFIIPEEFDWGYYCSESTFIGVKNGKRGVFGYDGLVVIPAKYDSITQGNGVFYVCENNKKGVLSEKGDIIINVEFDMIEYVSPSGYLESFYLCEKAHYCSLYTNDGCELLPAKYKKILCIGHKLFAVQELEGKFRILNENGLCINDISFDEVYSFGYKNKENYVYNESKEIENALYAIVMKDGLYGAINTFGELVLPLRYKELYYVNRNIFYGDGHYVDFCGKRVVYSSGQIIIIDDEYDSEELLDNGLILVQKNGLYGCINQKGTVIIPFKYKSLSCYKEFLIVSIINAEDRTERKGVINFFNDIIVPFKYHSLSGVDDFLIATLYNEDDIDGRCGEKGVINFKNDILLPFSKKYDDIKITKNLILYKIGWNWGNNNLWGAYNNQGQKICEPIYTQIIDITDNLIKVSKSSNDYGYEITDWGLINYSGTEILPLKYSAIADTSINGLIEIKKGKRIGYVDFIGHVLLEPYYRSVSSFIDGYAIVSKESYCYDQYGNDREKLVYGVIDCSFKEIIPCAFKKIEYEPEFGLFKTELGYKTLDGRFIAEIDGKKLLVDAKYKHCESFYDGCAIAVQIKNEKKCYGLINAKSEDVFPPIFQNLELLDNGLYKFKINEKFGFVNAEGNIIMSNRYHVIGKFEDNLACVLINDQRLQNEKLCGYIDTKGHEILPPSYEFVGKRNNKYSVVMKNNLWGLFGIENHQLTMIPNVAFVGPCMDNRCKINVGGRYDKNDKKTTGGLWGYVSPDGQIVIEPIYEQVFAFHDGVAAVKQNKKWGFIDINGAMIVPCEYDKVEHSFYNGQGSVIKDDIVFVFDKNGCLLSSYELENENNNYYSGYDDTPSVYDNPYYNDNLDMDQQSIEFWNNF